MVAMATNMAVLAFNCGAVKGRNRLISGLNLEMGAHALSIAQKKDMDRLKSSEIRAREVTKRKRASDRGVKKMREANCVEEEGEVYWY